MPTSSEGEARWNAEKWNAALMKFIKLESHSDGGAIHIAVKEGVKLGTT
jgi:hypothetical protein